MTPARPKFAVDPDLCDRCGRGPGDCIRACDSGAIRVGVGYIFVDWDRCTGCLECIEVCDSGALAQRGVAPRGGGAVSGRSVPRAAGADVVPLDAARRKIARRREAAAAPGMSATDVVWTRSDALIALLTMLVALLALDYVLGMKIVTLMPESGRVFARVAGLGASYVVELIVLALLAKRHGVSLLDATGLRPFARSAGSAATSAGLVLALLVGSRALTSVYGLLTQSLGWEPKIRWTSDLTRIFGGGVTGLALAILLVALVGPIVEEIAFRGVVQPALARNYGRAFGILGSALLFGIYHFDPWMFVPTFVLGVALGWLAEKRQGVWPPIALHVLYNAVTVVAVFWVVAQ